MEKDYSTPPRKRGFSFLSLLLGILFGIIITIGAIAGCGALLVYTDLKTVFNVVGFNNQDENGNQYINTDKDNGGVSTVLDLLSTIGGWAGNIGNMSLGEIEKVLPMTDSLVGNIFDTFGDYVARDQDVLISDIKATTFGNLGTLLQGLVDDIVPAALLSTVDLGEITDNALMSTLIYGPQADYVEMTSTPVWYNEYKLVGDNYLLNGDLARSESEPLSSELTSYLVKHGEDTSATYRLNYFQSGDSYFVVQYNEKERTFTSTELAFPHVKEAYDKCTGYYYMNASNERVVVTPVTISTLSGNNGGEGMTSLLDNVELLDMLGGEQEKLIVDILGGITVGNILSSELEITEKVNNLELTALDLGVTVDSNIMMYLVYGVTNIVEAVEGVDWQFVANLETEEDGTIEVYIESADKQNVDRVYEILEDGTKEDITATTVSTIGERVDTITIPAIVEIDINEPIMAYLGYSVYNVREVIVEEGETLNYSHTAKYDLLSDDGTTTPVDAYVVANENGIISRAYYIVDGEEVNIGGTTTDAIGDIVGGVTEALALSDILDIGPDDKMMAYLAFKITNIQAVEAADASSVTYSHTATLELNDEAGSTVDAYITTDDDGFISSVYYIDEQGNQVYADATTIQGVTDAVEEISIPAIVDIDPNEPIMVYLGYSVYSVREVLAQEDVELDYTHTGKYDIEDENGKVLSTVTAYIKSNGTAISGVYYLRAKTPTTPETGTDTGTEVSPLADVEYEQVNIKGTSTDEISDVITGMTDKLALADFMDVTAPTADDTNAIMMYIAYGVRAIIITTEDGTTKVTGTYVHYYFDENGNIDDTKDPTLLPVEIYADAENLVDRVVVTDHVEIDGVDMYDTIIDGTTINGVSVRVNTVSDNLTLGDFMEIAAPTTEDKNAVMMYMAYGVRSVVIAADGTITGTYVPLNEDETEVAVTIIPDPRTANVLRVEDATGKIYTGTTISDISERVSGVDDNLTLGDFMDVDMPTEDEKNAIMLYIAYGVRNIVIKTTTVVSGDGGNTTTTTVTTVTGEHVEYEKDASGEFVTDENGDLKYTVTPVEIRGTGTVSEVVEIKQDGDEGTPKVFTGTTISGVSDRVSTVSDNLALSDFVDVDAPTLDDHNTIMMYMAYGVRQIAIDTNNTPLDTTDDKITGIYDPIPVGEETVTPIENVVVNIYGTGTDKKVSSVTSADGNTVYAGTTIGQINTRISGVTTKLAIEELMDIDEDNTIMNALRDSTVDDLADNIAKLSIQEIYKDAIYETDNTTNELIMYKAVTTLSESLPAGSLPEKVFSPDYIYYTLDETGEYVFVNDAAAANLRGKLTSDEFNTGVAAGTTYYTYGEAQGVWKFMLYGKQTADSTSTTEILYSVNDMDIIMENVQTNISNAQLFELEDAGIISTNDNLLDRLFAGEVLGTYNIQSLLNALSTLTTDPNQTTP